MARTINEIYNQLTASKESNTTLDGLLPNPDSLQQLYTYENFRLLANTVLKNMSKSKVAIWRLIMYSVAVFTWMQESLYLMFKNDVDEITRNREVGQLPWYSVKAKEFQLGDLLVWQGTYYAYNEIDDTKKIVSHAAANVSNGIIILKTAKGDIGSLEKLSTDEQASFEMYMKGTSLPYSSYGIVPAGVNMTIISSDPDELRFAIDVFYNPLILSSTGVSLSDGVTIPVNDAITNYIQQMPFDSKFRVLDLVDAIQSVNGVRNVVVKNCDAKTSVQLWGDSVDVMLQTGQQYVSYAGYFKMGDDYGFSSYYDYPTNLIPTITYISE